MREKLLKNSVFILIIILIAQMFCVAVYSSETENIPFIDSELLSLSESGISVAGFTLLGDSSNWAAARCGLSNRKVLGNGNVTSDLSIIFDASENNEIKKACFNVTVRDDYQSGIIADGALNSMLYGSNTGEDGTWVAITDGVHNNEPLDKIADGTRHFYTYTLTWDNIGNYRYLKFAPENTPSWSFYIHHATIYGVATTPVLLLSDDSNLINVNRITGFAFGNAGSNCGLGSNKVSYRSGTGEAYAIYDVEDFGKLSYIEFDVTVSGSNHTKLTGNAQLDDMLYVSSDGAEFVLASHENPYKASMVLKSNQNGHYSYTLTYNVSSDTKLIKFSANKFSDWQMYLTGVRLYGKEQENIKKELLPLESDVLILGDYVQNLNKITENAGFSFSNTISSKTGLANNRPTAYKSGTGNSYLVYHAPNDGTVNYAQINITVNSFSQKYKLDDLNNNIYFSKNGVDFHNAENVQCEYEKVNFDGTTQYTNCIIKMMPPEGTKFIKIDASEFTAWEFIITNVLLYGPRIEFDYTSIPSLYEINKDYFNLATAIEPQDAYDYNELILTQFNEITIENQMKPNVIHPEENKYYYNGADQLVEFAKENNLRVRGHGLVYGSTTPDWFFKDENGGAATEDDVMARLENHIKTIVSRYKGKIYCYDVVNEAFGHKNFNGSDKFYSFFKSDEYIKNAFIWAHEADPDAILILNDNYFDIPSKRQLIYEKILEWKNEGIPVHGIGFQNHLFLDTSLEAIEETIKLFSQIPDFKIFITELDISAYGHNDQNVSNVYPEYMVDEVKEMLGRKYASLFDIYRKYSAHIETVGTWNVCDKECWLDENWASGRKHYATLFGYNLEPNPAFYGVADVEKKLPRCIDGTVVPIIRNNNYYIDNDILYIKGNDTGAILVKLYSNFGTKSEIYSEIHTVNGDYEINIPISSAGYNGKVSPDYILEVTDSLNKISTDNFTYYTKENRYNYYTVTDEMNDFSKVYRMKNCTLKKATSDYKDECGFVPYVFWANANLGDGEVVYSVPDLYSFDKIKIETLIGIGYKPMRIYYSTDDIEYLEHDTNWKYGVFNSWLYKATTEIADLPSDAKYIKIILEAAQDGDEANRRYLKNISITTKEKIFDCDYNEKENLYLKNLYFWQNGKINENITSGKLNGICKIENCSDSSKNATLVMASYDGARLKNITFETVVIQSGNEEIIEVEFMHSGRETVKLFVFDEFKNLIPLFDSISEK